MGNIKDIKKNAKNYIGEMFTGVIIIAIAIYSFVQIGINENVGTDFWITFAVNFAIMLLITSVWYPSAKTKAQAQDEGYKVQRIAYGNLINKIVETNNQKNLSRFCDWATEENKIFKLKQELIKINVDYDVYNEFKNKPKEIENIDYLTKKQKKKLVKLIEVGVNVDKISYMRIMTGIKIKDVKYDTTNGENKYDAIKLTSKILISIISSIFMGFIIFTIYGFTWTSIAQLLTWLVLIFWNIFTSYNAGYKAISIKRMEYYKKLKTFLEEFISSEYFNLGQNTQKKEDVCEKETYQQNDNC